MQSWPHIEFCKADDVPFSQKHYLATIQGSDQSPVK